MNNNKKKSSKIQQLLSTYTDDDLKEFVFNKKYNPKTGRKLKKCGKLYNSLVNESNKRDITKKTANDMTISDLFEKYTNNSTDIINLILEFTGNNELYYVVDIQTCTQPESNISICTSLNMAKQISEKYCSHYKFLLDHYNRYNNHTFYVYILQAPIRFKLNTICLDNLDQRYILQKISCKKAGIITNVKNNSNVSLINNLHIKSYVRRIYRSNVIEYYESTDDVISDLENKIKDCCKSDNDSLNYNIHSTYIKNSKSHEYIYSKNINGYTLVSVNINKYSMYIHLSNEFYIYQQHIKKCLCKKFIELSS